MPAKFLWFVLPCCFLFHNGFSQPADIVLTTYTNQPSIRALNSITLKPGFHIPEGKDVLLSVGGIPQLTSTPTGSQNYILTRTFRTPVKESELYVTRGIDEENQAIQYFDGLGRPSQNVELMASPTYKDIVQHIEYDGLGRESVKYLPYAEQTSANGSYKTTAKTNQGNYYQVNGGWDADVVKTPNPYAVTVFENSPLNRVEQQGAPGAIWQPAAIRSNTAGRTVVIDYGTNVAPPSLEAVKVWTVSYNSSGTPTGAEAASSYAAGKLYKTVNKDENWVLGKGGTVEEYTDFEGRVVLKRVWESESKKLDTYYIYDNLGGLRYVLPPAVVQTIFTELATDPVFDKYIYAYRYDVRRRLIEKKIPGRGWEWTVYNKNDLPILVQDAMQRAKNPKEWTYTKYDAFGRMTETGTLTASYATQAAAQTAADNHATVSGKHWESRGVNASQYSNVSFPTSSLSRRTVNYYDNYNKFSGTVDTLQLAARAIIRSQKVHSLLTGSRVYTDSGTDSLLTLFYYDAKGRIVQTASRNHLGGKDIVTNTYLFTDEVETSKREHWTSLTTLPATTVLTTNRYDHVGRLIETKKKLNSQAEIVQSQLVYNEIGQLKEKKLHVSGSNAAQKVAYSYNERGWTDSINNPSAVTDLQRFGMALNYANNQQAYNGNIGSVQWNTKVSASQPQTPLQTYTYSYDKLNRLTKASYAASNKNNWFNEELAYDVMGNIDTLRRSNGSTGWYNHFKYNYTGNKLNSVSDAGSANRGNIFTYNANGSVKANTRLGITDIEYNYLNLPTKFVKESQQLVYTYDATGKKLKKTFGTAVTDYVDGIQYKNGVLEFIQTEEGRIVPNGSSFFYEYFLTDHLGNTRAIVNHLGEVKQIQDYYAFGMEMNTGAGLNTASNHYKYNGKEKQVELGLDQLDYGARFYDSEIGRWNVLDPLAEEFYSSSPYNYVDGNPIVRIDPDGRAWFTRYVGENGQTLLNTNDGSNDVVVVPWGRTNEFMTSVEYSGRMLDDPSWNGNWKDELGVVISSSELVRPYSTILSEKGRATFIEHLFNPQITDLGEIIFHEGIRQWGDPATAIPAVVSAFGSGLGAFQNLSGKLNAAKTGWKVGEPITNLTAKGNVPVWSTVRQRFWKNEAFLNGSTYSESNLLRMQKGLAPQFRNTTTGVMESMELHHTIPQRNGGLFEFIKVTPEQHRLIDPFRR